MKVKVEYIFSRNKKIGSKIISFFTRHLAPHIEPTPSHIAVLINSRWVHEAVLSDGVRVLSYQKWLSINEQTHKIPCARGEVEYGIVKKFIRDMKGKKYDYLGVIYFGIQILKQLLFKTKIPSINKWNSENKFFCSELVGKLSGIDYQMTSPTQIADKLECKISEVVRQRK